MTEKTPTSSPGYSADWFLRGALTKIGDTFDRLTGRKWIPSSSLATSELISAMKKLLDSEAKEIPGKGTVVPHNIKLKMQWDKFSTDAEGALAKLETELLAAAADHINDGLYYTFAPLRLEVKPDYFTEGVKLLVSFDKFDDEDDERELNVTVPNAAPVGPAAVPDQPELSEQANDTFIARFELKGSRRDRRFEFPPGKRLSVGRTTANEFVIDDASVSKIHASLICDADRHLLVADTGSTNGTFINGERISYGKATRLFEDDKVKFGDVEVVFEHIPNIVPAISKPAAELPTGAEAPLGRDTVAIGGMTFTSRKAAEPEPAKVEVDPSTEKTFVMDPPKPAQTPEPGKDENK